MLIILTGKGRPRLNFTSPDLIHSIPSRLPDRVTSLRPHSLCCQQLLSPKPTPATLNTETKYTIGCCNSAAGNSCKWTLKRTLDELVSGSITGITTKTNSLCKVMGYSLGLVPRSKCDNSQCSIAPDSIAEVVYSYNTAVQESTRHSPFEIMFGRKGNLPIDFNIHATYDADAKLQEFLQVI